MAVSPDILNTEQMQMLEHKTAETGISRVEMMERAGNAVAAFIRRTYSPCKILVCCGPGNNGGDGIVTAIALRKQGWRVTLASDCFDQTCSKQTAHFRKQWAHSVISLAEAKKEHWDLIVDALFGIGLPRPITGIYLDTIAWMNASGVPIVSIDMPSGINSDTAQIEGIAVNARQTVTFQHIKIGQVLLPGLSHVGQLIVVDIGLLKDTCYTAQINTPHIWQKHLPHLSLTDHKYARGQLVILGGNTITGASRLAAHAARRMGAGMVIVLCDSRVIPIYNREPGLIVHDISHLDQYLEDSRTTGFLIGPGFGVGKETCMLTQRLIQSGHPCVIDADAITSFAKNSQDLFALNLSKCVLTPHHGEFVRVFSEKETKIASTYLAAKESGATVLYKGADTVISDGEEVYVNTNGSPHLATAGTGDVLAGMIAGLLARDVTPLDAALIASWLHADCAERIGHGLIAEDISNALPAALKDLYSRS
jgi:NAD(P)H-hydrate epimerase